MISDARRAWLQDNLHTILLRKFPNLIRFFDLMNKLYKKQRDLLLDEGFHERFKAVRHKAYPFLLAYLAGCCAPERNSGKEAHLP